MSPMGPSGDAFVQATDIDNSEKIAAPLPAVNMGMLSYEELHKKSASILPSVFEGAKLIVSKGLSPQFEVSHALTLSEMKNGYHFGATYVGTKKTGPRESFPLLMGEIDLLGNTSALVIHQLTENVRVKLQSQTQKSQLVTALLGLDRVGKRSSIGLKLVNPSLVANRLYFSANFLRHVTENVDIGAEYVYQLDPNIPGNQMSSISYALRYTAPWWALTGTMASNGLHVSYHHKQTDHLQFAVDLESSSQESVATFGYQVEIPQTMVLRASVDTNWTVGAVLEKKLSRQLPFTFILSGMYNQSKMAAKFGIGFILG